MKIKGSDAPRRADPLAPAKRTAPAAAAGMVSAIPPVEDQMSVLDLPTEEITPRVRRAISQLLREVDELRQQVAVMDRRLAEAERLADLDPLAPIANRRAFVRELSRVISYSERYGVDAALLFFDVNDMKEVNDRHGHRAGDAVLLHVANSLLIHVRESDIVGRLGGDEFAVILVQTNEEQAITKGAQLARLIGAAPVHYEGQDIPVGVSFGAHGFKKGENPDDVIDQADRRMYAQKRRRRAGSSGDDVGDQ